MCCRHLLNHFLLLSPAPNDNETDVFFGPQKFSREAPGLTTVGNLISSKCDTRFVFFGGFFSSLLLVSLPHEHRYASE
jgi:hypothetical protein